MRTVIYLLAALLVFGVLLAKLRATAARLGAGNPGGAELGSPGTRILESCK